MIRRDAEPFGQRGDDLAEAAGQDVDPVTVPLEEVEVAPDRGRRLVQDPVGQLLDMGATGGQQLQPPTQGRAKVDLARHRLLGQGRNLGLSRRRIGGIGQGDLSERFQRLDANQGGIEVEDEGRRGHGTALADLRTCSNKKGAQSPPFRTIFLRSDPTGP